MNDALGLVGGVYIGGGFNVDSDEEIFVEDNFSNIIDYDEDNFQIETTFSVYGVE